MRKRIAVCMLLLAVPAFAQQGPTTNQGGNDNAVLQQEIRDLQDRIIALEGQMRLLKSQSGASAPSVQGPGSTAPQAAAATSTAAETQAQAAGQSVAQEPVRLGGAGVGAANALNPDISMIGDFIAATGHNRFNPAPVMEMHESEVGFQAIIDPYARGDFFLSFGETGVNLEEGYITFTALPAGFVARGGKMRAAFGKVNTMHNHVLPWVDRPLVSQNLVGGEDGIDDAGVSIERILPAPKGIFLEATGQLFRGDSGNQQSPLFQATNKSDVSAVAHLRSYKDITESTNIDLGLSYARGHNDQGSNFLTQLYGIDA